MITNITINGKPIPSSMIIDLTLEHSVEMIAPRAELVVADGTQLLMAGLNLMIGSNIKMVCVDDDASKEEDFLLDMYVSEIEIPLADERTFEGQIKVHLMHPLEFFQAANFKSWGDDMMPDAIIKDILNSNPAYKDYIKDLSDIQGCQELGHPLYQQGELGLGFIRDNILPYTTINDMPALFYVDFLGKVHLTTLRHIWAKTPKAVLGHRDAFPLVRNIAYTAQVSREFYYEIAPNSLSFGISPRGCMMRCLSTHYTLGEDTTDSVATGQSKLFLKVDDMGALPIDNMAVAMMGDQVTNSVTMRNMNFADMASAAITAQKDIYKLIYAGMMLTQYVDTDINIGDTVYLISARDEGSEHWFEGQWYIYGMKKYYVDRGIIQTSVLLARPCMPRIQDFSIIQGDYYKARG